MRPELVIFRSSVGSGQSPTPGNDRDGFIASATVRSKHYPLAWLAGARSEALRLSPSEAGFYAGLGVALALTAMVSGFTAMIAVSIVLRTALRRVLLVGVIWTVIVGNLDRLLMMTLTSRSRIASLIPRVALSLIFAALVSTPLVLTIFAPEINAKLQTNVEAAIQKSTRTVDNFYAPKLAADQQQLAAIQSAETGLQNQIDQNRFLESCEVGLTDCSTTKELGNGPYAQHYAQLAATEQSQLAALQAQDASQTQALNSDIANLTKAEAAQASAGSRTAGHNTGLIAHEEALAAITKGHPEVQHQVLFLTLAFLALDLAALMIKLIHVWGGTSDYEAAALKLRRRDQLSVKRLDADIDIEEARITETREATIEVDRARIQLERDEELSQYDSPLGRTWTGSSRDAAQGKVHAFNLDDYVDSIRHHEAEPVDVPRILQLGAWVGTALMLATTFSVFTIFGHPSPTSEALCLVPLAAAVALAAYTKGFRQAPAWALRACFGVFIAGLLLPATALIIR